MFTIILQILITEKIHHPSFPQVVSGNLCSLCVAHRRDARLLIFTVSLLALLQPFLRYAALLHALRAAPRFPVLKSAYYADFAFQAEHHVPKKDTLCRFYPKGTDTTSQ